MLPGKVIYVPPQVSIRLACISSHRLALHVHCLCKKNFYLWVTIIHLLHPLYHRSKTSFPFAAHTYLFYGKATIF